jgi:hypothetical protein
MTDSSLVYEQLNRIQQKLKAPKGNVNSFGNYKYRSCEDILEAVKPLLDKTTLVLSDEMVQVGDRYYVKATAALMGDGKLVSVTAYAREAEEKKGMDAAQITGSASSYARKYALNGLFAIDDTKDADTMDNTERSKTRSARPIKEPDPTDTWDDTAKYIKPPVGAVVRKTKDGLTITSLADQPLMKCEDCHAEISEKVKDFSIIRYGKMLCFDHQKDHEPVA